MLATLDLKSAKSVEIATILFKFAKGIKPAVKDAIVKVLELLKTNVIFPAALELAETIPMPVGPVAPCVPAIALVKPCLLALTKSTNGISDILIYHWSVIYTVLY